MVPVLCVQRIVTLDRSSPAAEPLAEVALVTALWSVAVAVDCSPGCSHTNQTSKTRQEGWSSRRFWTLQDEEN